MKRPLVTRISMIVFGLCMILLLRIFMVGETPHQAGILWAADMETADLSQWTRGGGGGDFNTGTGKVAITSQVAHSGQYALALSIENANQPGNPQAARIFRWQENPEEAYYSAWFYFPGNYQPGQYWNVFQFKSRTATKNDPMWILNVGSGEDGGMFFYLWDGLNQQSYNTQLTGQALPLPLRTWFHVEAYYRRATDRTGQITIWQNDTRIFNVDNVQTALADNVQWSLNNYTDGITPDDPTIYVDDAVISTGRMGSDNSTVSR